MARADDKGGCHWSPWEDGHLGDPGDSRGEDMELVAGFDIAGAGRPLLGGTAVSSVSQMRGGFSRRGRCAHRFHSGRRRSGERLYCGRHGSRPGGGNYGILCRAAARMKEAIEGKVAAVISPNFSLGVNVFWKLVGLAAAALKDYDIELIEAHHNQKKDAPSGTALAAVEVIKKRARSCGGRLWPGGSQAAEKGDWSPCHPGWGYRGGPHRLFWPGPGERLEIKHQAHSRTAFASGAVRAARWVVEAQPGIYSMADVLG